MDGISPSGPLWPRPEIDAFSLAESLRDLCERAHAKAGWDISLLLLDDATTGLSCVVSVTGIPDESREILVGAGVGPTEEIGAWLAERGPATVGVSDRLGAGTPLALEDIVGGALDGHVRDGQAIVAPVTVSGEVAGVLVAYLFGHDAVTPVQTGLVEIVAAGVASAVAQSRSAERATRRFESGQLLARLANRVYRLNEPSEILSVTCDDVRDHLEADFCGVLKPAGDGLAVAQRSDRPGQPVDAGALPITDRLEQACRHGVAVIETRAGDRGEPTQSILVAPILIREEMYAVLTCANVTAPRRWQPFELELLRGVADLLGVALSEARLHVEQEAARKDLECLLAASRALAQANDRDEALGELLALATGALSVTFAAVLLAGEGDEVLRAVATRGVDTEPAAVALASSAVAAEAFRTGTGVAYGRAGEPGGRFVLHPDSRSALAVPMQVGDRRLGVLLVEDASAREFSPRETSLALGLSHEAAVAVHRAGLFDRVALGKREWEATFDAMVDAVVLFNRDGGVVRANRAAALAFGVEHAALRGARCCRLLCTETTDGSCATAEAIESDAPVVRRMTLWGADFVLTVNPIRNRAGVPTGAVALLRQTQRLEGVDEIDVRVARAVARSRGAVVLVDRDGLVRWANPAAEELFGAALVPLAPIVTLADEPGRDRLTEALERVAVGASHGVAMTLPMGGRDVELLASSAGDESRDELVLVMARAARDTGESPAVQDASRRGAQPGIFRLSRVLLGLLDADDHAVRASLAELVERLDRAGRSRVDRVVEPLELNRVVEEAIESTRPSWEAIGAERGVAYGVRLDPCRSARVLGSAAELRDAFAELILNAVDAQPEGGEVVIRTIERHGLVGAQVRDGGPGIPREIRGHSADPFVTTKGGRHAGLGLSIASAAVARHGGRLSARHSAEDGVTIHVVLPQYGGSAEGDAAPVEAEAVVFVSDRLLRLRVLDRLDEAGVSAVWAADTRETVWALDFYRPGLFVVDGATFEAASDRVSAICRTSAGVRTCVLVADLVPEAAGQLIAEGIVQWIRPEKLGELGVGPGGAPQAPS